MCVYSECTARPNMYTKHVHKACTLASFPGPRPASHCLQYGEANDWKLGGGLGTRLHVHSIVFPHLATPSTFTCGGPTSQQLGPTCQHLHQWRAYLPAVSSWHLTAHPIECTSDPQHDGVLALPSKGNEE